MFYEFHEPEYASDAEEDAKNCCFPDPGELFTMPGIRCPYCGATWAASGERLLTARPLSAELRKELSRPRAIPFGEYETLLRMLRKELHLRSSSWILPGTRVGKLVVQCKCSGHLQDFMWIWSAGPQIVVTEPVVATLT